MKTRHIAMLLLAVGPIVTLGQIAIAQPTNMSNLTNTATDATTNAAAPGNDMADIDTPGDTANATDDAPPGGQ